MRFNTSRLIFGGMVLSILVFVFSWWVNSTRRELRFITENTPLTAAQIPTLEEEQMVLLTGAIQPNSPRFYSDLVVGVREQYYSGEDGGWEVEEDPEVRLQLALDDETVVPLFIEGPYPRGDYQTYTSGNTRWRGYGVNTSITTIAVVNQAQPLLFESVKHFGGSPASYIQDLKRGLRVSRILAGVFMGICALIMFWPQRK